MSKEHLLNLLCRVYVQEISADEAYDELGDLIDRIKRLEEAGDAMERYCDAISAENWRKAKEAKP